MRVYFHRLGVYFSIYSVARPIVDSDNKGTGEPAMNLTAPHARYGHPIQSARFRHPPLARGLFRHPRTRRGGAADDPRGDFPGAWVWRAPRCGGR